LSRQRDFRLLWSAQTVSELGSQVSLLAIPLVAVRALHATTFAVGALTASSTVAFLLVGLPAGVRVDRSRRRWVMIGADVARLLALGSVPVAYALGHLGLAQLFVVSFVAGVFSVLFDVAYQSYLPSLVGQGHLVEGNAKLAGSAQVAQVAGPSAAGGLVQLIGGAYAVAVDAASFLFSAVALVAIGEREQGAPVTRQGRGRLHREVGEGLRFVFGQPVLRAITATTATANLFSGVQTAVEVVFLVRVVHAAPGVIGLVFGAGSVGGLVAALLAAPIARRLGGARATFAGILVTGGGLLIPLSSPGAGALFFAGGLFMSSFGVVVYNIVQVSFRQRLCPPQLLGRMNASVRFLVSGVLPFGALAGGALGSVIGLRTSLWVAMGGEVAAGGWLVASPLRRAKEFPAPPG
jgi:hypothetical protein